MQIQNLFPVPMLEAELGRDYTEEELNYVYSLKRKNIIGNELSVESEILNAPEMSNIKEWLENVVNTFLQSTHNPRDGVGLRITQSWASFSDQWQYHHDHKHSNSFYSGVLYIDARDDKIMFTNPNRLFPLFVQPKSPEYYTMHNSETWWVPATTGKLVIFPSLLVHGVPAVQEGYTRVSIAFNTFPTGEIANKPGLWHLDL